jgi:heme exporter protein CcmD
MNWSSWSEFFEMGGYAFYVWSSVLATFLLVLIEVRWIVRGRRLATAFVKAQKTMNDEVH